MQRHVTATNEHCDDIPAERCPCADLFHRFPSSTAADVAARDESAIELVVVHCDEPNVTACMMN